MSIKHITKFSMKKYPSTREIFNISGIKNIYLGINIHTGDNKHCTIILKKQLKDI